MLRHYLLMEFSDVLGRGGVKPQPICVAFAFVPAKPPLGRVGTALLMTCCSLQQELGAWYHADGTSYVSGVTRVTEGAVWSLRCFLPLLGLLDAVAPHAVVSTANKAPVELGSCRACVGSTSALYGGTQCRVRVWLRGHPPHWDHWDWTDGSGSVGFSGGEVLLAGITCSRAGFSPENQTPWHAEFLHIP